MAKALETDRYFRDDLSSQPGVICAIDASTTSLAFTIYSYKNLSEHGKIDLKVKISIKKL
jgi:hypothetical protein